MRTLLAALALLIALSACTEDDGVTLVDFTLPPADITSSSAYFEVAKNYGRDLSTFQRAEGLSGAWWDWMLIHREDYVYHYARARLQPWVSIRVQYADTVTYDPPWASEAEHMAAIERLAEAAFPGWDVIVTDDPRAVTEAVVVLGHTGESHVGPNNWIYLAQETVLPHELGHILGAQHHYPTPIPDEGPCIMSRDAQTWGPAERFVLDLDPTDPAEVAAAVEDIARRLPR